MPNEERVAKMRQFLGELTPKGWRWIGQSAYLTGRRGVFRLDLYSGGTADHIAGLRGVFMPHVGGEPDRITLEFGDFIVATNPKNNPHGEGRAVSSSSNGFSAWEWYIVVPKSMTPFHDAIRAWTNVHGEIV